MGESISGGRKKKKKKLKNALSSDMSSMLRQSKGECGLCRMGQRELRRRAQKVNKEPDDSVL